MRSRQQHLTSAEIAIIREGYVARLPIAYVAEQVDCSTRNVTKYYGYFRAEGVRQGARDNKHKVSLPRVSILDSEAPTHD